MATECRCGTVCTNCDKPGHTASNCISKPCLHCGKHYPKSAEHDYVSCSGNAGSGAFLGSVCKVNNDSSDTDTNTNVDNNSVHSDDTYVDNNNGEIGNNFSVNNIQIIGDIDDYNYMYTHSLHNVPDDKHAPDDSCDNTCLFQSNSETQTTAKQGRAKEQRFADSDDETDMTLSNLQQISSKRFPQ